MPMRVLVVEDDPKMRELLVQGLTENDFTVDSAMDGEQALAMASQVDHDAIVLDVMLPGVDGFTVCRELRKRGRSTPIPMQQPSCRREKYWPSSAGSRSTAVPATWRICWPPPPMMRSLCAHVTACGR